jgi:uncharacterized membrane protein SpoIIM required for sporulation
MEKIRNIIKYIPTWVLILLLILLLYWYVALRIDYTYNVSQAKTIAEIKHDFDWAFQIGNYEAKLKSQTAFCVAVMIACGALLLSKLFFRWLPPRENRKVPR